MIVTIYGKEWCAYCDRAKELLEDVGIDYTFMDVEADDQAMAEMLNHAPAAKTVPQILVDNVLVGGYDELRKYCKDKEFI